MIGKDHTSDSKDELHHKLKFLFRGLFVVPMV